LNDTSVLNVVFAVHFLFLFNIVFGACLVYTVLSVHVHAVRPAFAGHAGLAFIGHKAHEELLPE